MVFKNFTIKKFINFLASRKLSVISMGLLIGLILMWVVPFQIYGVPAWRIENIANKTWFFRLAYALLLLNILLCMIEVLPGTKKRIKNFPVIPLQEELGNGKCITEIDLAGQKEHLLNKLKQMVGKKRFHVKTNDNNSVLIAYKGRYAPVGNLLFHIALLILASGILLSTTARFNGETVIAEGQTFDSKNLSLFVAPSLETLKIKNNIPELTFRVDKVTPEFWRDKFLFTNLAARISYGTDLLQKSLLKLNAPLLYNDTVLSLKGFGYTPNYIIEDKAGNIIEDSLVNLAVFPSGKEDYFKPTVLPYEVHVIIWSDYYKEKGQIKNKSNNLRNPLLTVYILKDSGDKKVAVYQGNLKLGEKANFEGYKISFPEIRYYGEFRILYDPWLVLIFAGYVVAVIGLVWRLIFYRRAIYFFLSVSEAGKLKIKVTGFSDYYTNSFQRYLHTITKLIKSGW